MAITIGNKTWRTLLEPLYVNGKLIKEARVRNTRVYPDGDNLFCIRGSFSGVYPTSLNSSKITITFDTNKHADLNFTIIPVGNFVVMQPIKYRQVYTHQDYKYVGPLHIDLKSFDDPHYVGIVLHNYDVFDRYTHDYCYVGYELEAKIQCDRQFVYNDYECVADIPASLKSDASMAYRTRHDFYYPGVFEDLTQYNNIPGYHCPKGYIASSYLQEYGVFQTRGQYQGMSSNINVATTVHLDCDFPVTMTKVNALGVPEVRKVEGTLQFEVTIDGIEYSNTPGYLVGAHEVGEDPPHWIYEEFIHFDRLIAHEQDAYKAYLEQR